MSIRSRSSRQIVAVVLATLSLLLAAVASGPATAQGGEYGILLRSFACPNDAPADVWDECDGIVGAVYRVEVDGVEIAESPVTTVKETGVSHGVFFQVPASGVSITVTPISGAPDGYAPAAGYAPYTASIADLPDVGMGGESSGPGIILVYAPVGDTAGDDSASTDDGASTGDEGASSGDSSETTTLPRTGSGATTSEMSEQTAPIALLLAAATLFGAGIVTRRQRSI